MNNIMYHITPFRNIPNILTEGLIVNSESYGFVHRQTKIKLKKQYNILPIFLTDDIQYIMNNQLTNNFITKNKMVTLKINTTDLDIHPHMSNCYEEGLNIHCPHEYVCKENIPVENIKVVNE